MRRQRALLRAVRQLNRARHSPRTATPISERGASVTPASEAASFRSGPQLRRARSSQCGSVPHDAVRETSIENQPNGWRHRSAQQAATGLQGQ